MLYTKDGKIEFHAKNIAIITFNGGHYNVE